MDERRNDSNGVGNKMYQLQPVVVLQAAEEVSLREVEATLEEGSEDDLLLDVLTRELFPGGGPPLHLRLRSRQPPVNQLFRMHAASASISLLGLELDLIWHRVLMHMHRRSAMQSGSASLVLAGVKSWTSRREGTMVAISLQCKRE
jgi:hypothetical protein